MAIFNPAVPQVDPGSIGSPNTYLGWSKGTSQPEADRSGELLLKGIGDTIDAAVKGTDLVIKENIKDDIYNAVDAERQGYTDALETFSGVKRKPGGIMRQQATPNSPTEVQNVGSQVESLQNAYNSGKISNTYYYGRLNTLAKTMRSQYPGYRDYIDSQISSVTGVNPANAYITSLLGDINRNTEKKDSDVNRVMSTLYSEEMRRVPGALQRATEIMRNPTAENITEANMFISKSLAWKHDKDMRDYRNSSRTQDRAEAKDTATDDLNVTAGRAAAQYADNLVYTVQKGDGTAAPRKIADIVSAAMGPNGVKPSSEQAKEMAMIVQQERRRIFNEQWANATKIIPGTRETLASRAGGNEAAKKIINDSLVGIDMLGDALSKENYTLAADAANTVSAITDDVRRRQYEDPSMGPYWTHVSIMRRDLGDQAVGEFFRSELANKDSVAAQFKDLSKQYKIKYRSQPDLSANPEMGAPATLRQTFDDSKRKGITDKGFYQAQINEIDRLTDPSAPLKEKQNLAIAFFDPANRGMMANFNPSETDARGNPLPKSLNQNTVWSKLTSDKVTAEMRKLGGEYWTNYVNWVEGEFGRTMTTNILSAKDMYIPEGGKIGWNNETKKFVLDYRGEDLLFKNLDNLKIPTGASGPWGGATVDGAVFRNSQRVLQNINRQLEGVTNVAKQNGSDVDTYLYTLLRDMGAGPKITAEMMQAIQLNRGAKKPNG